MVRTGLLGTVVAASLALGWWLGASSSVRNAPAAAGAVERVDGGQRAPTGELVSVRASFGPDCEEALVGAVDGARAEVLVAIYSLTRRSVTSALARAAKRGVKVEVRYDAKSADESRDMPEAIAFLKRNKVRCAAVEFADSRAKMHHKFTVIDRRTVLTGSYNYTSTATEVNRENVVRIDSRPVAEAFAAEFAALTQR